MSGGSSGAVREDARPRQRSTTQVGRGRAAEIRRRAGATVAPLVAALALVSAVAAVPRLVDETIGVARADREGWERPELYPPDIGVPAAVVEVAEREIPEGAVYAIAVGDQIPVLAGGIGVVQALAYFLLPRRWTGELWRAEWVIAWGESSETLGVPIEREIGLAPNVNLVEVRR